MERIYEIIRFLLHVSGIVLFVSQVGGCGRPLSFEIRQFVRQSGDCSDINASCVGIDFIWPEAVDGPARSNEAINTFTRKYMVSTFAGIVGGAPADSERIEPLADAFIHNYEMFKAQYPDSAQRWEIEFRAEAVFSSTKTTTLRYALNAYTGGAHPINKTVYRIFDNRTGALLSIEDIVTDTTELTRRAETYFRQAKNLKDGEDYLTAGYWFKDGRFALPESIGFTGESLILFYDYYEIGPRPVGETTVAIPLEAVKDIVKRR